MGDVFRIFSRIGPVPKNKMRFYIFNTPRMGCNDIEKGSESVKGVPNSMGTEVIFTQGRQ